MPKVSHRYRITVTPIGKDGLQCDGRCGVEFDHVCDDNWMRLLESAQQLREVTGDERPALVVGIELLNGLMARHQSKDDDLFATLRPHMNAFTEELRRRSKI